MIIELLFGATPYFNILIFSTFSIEITLELAFDSLLLRSVCENESTASQKFGTELTKRLQSRLADLRAAKTVEELIAGKPKELPKITLSRYKVDLYDDYRLIFSPNHVKERLLEDGNTDWAQVSRIKILEIVQNYE